MAVELAVAYVNLVPSAKGMRSAIEKELDVDGVAKKEGASAGKSFVGAFSAEADKLKDVGKKMAAVGIVIGGGLFAAANAAGNLEAAIAANVQVMGDASDAVQDWAESSVEMVGLSERAALDAATSFGQLGKIIGLGGTELAGFSTELVTAAADMAAFKDVPVGQALEDLQSGFAGSTEVLRKYGIFLDEGSLKSAYFRETGEKVTGTLTAQQRIIATNSELWRQGADMWGQAEREAGGLARAQDNLKAEMENLGASIGTSVLPAVTSMTSALAKGLGAVGKFDQATGGMVGTIGGVVAAMSLLGGGALYTVGRVQELRASLAKMPPAARTVAAGFGVATVALAAFAIHQQRSAQHNQDMIDGFNELSTVADDQLIQTFADTLVVAALNGKGLAETTRELAATNVEGARRLLDVMEATMGVTDGTVALRNAILEEEAAVAKAAETQDKYADNLTEVSDRLNFAALSEDELTEARAAATLRVAEAATASDNLSQTYGAAAWEARHLEGATATLSVTHGKMRSEFDKVTAAASALQSAFDAVFGTYMDVEEASDNVRDGTEQLTVALTDNGATLDENTEAGRRNREQVRSQVDSILSYAEASVRAGDSTDVARDKVNFLTEGLKNQLVQAGLTEAEVNSYIETLGLTPENVDTAIALTNQEVARENVQTWLDSLGNVPEEKETQIQALIDAGAYVEAELALNELTRPRNTLIRVRTDGITPILPNTRSAGGRFVQGGSNLPTTVGEIPGRAGDEVILPLGNEARLRSLLGDSRVSPAIFDALDMGGASGGQVNFNGDTYVNERADVDSVAQAVLMSLAVA